MINLVKIHLEYDQLYKERIYDNYAWHQRAWTLFKHELELQKRNSKKISDKGGTPFLSRYILKPSYAELLVLSSYAPLRPEWCSHDNWQITKIDDSYLSQSGYLFDLYANPTKKIKKKDGNGGYTKNGRRVTLMESVSQRLWLSRKGEACGFCLSGESPLQIDKPINHRFNRRGKKGLHLGVRFQGALKVTDTPNFKKAFARGIGTAKGFGFGLLMIKPIHI